MRTTRASNKTDFFTSMENFHYKLQKLTELSQNLLAKVLTFVTSKYLVGQQFLNEQGHIFTTSKNQIKALVTYVNQKPSIVGLMKTNYYSLALITGNRLECKGLEISRMDAAVLSLLLLNIPEFEFSFHDDKHPKRSEKCSSTNHEKDQRCCSACDHTIEETLPKLLYVCIPL